MAQEAPAKSNQSSEQSQSKTTLSRQAQAPVALAPRELFSLTPFSLMRRMVEDFTGAALSGGDTRAALWSPTIEVVRRNGDIAIRAELPGLKPDEVRVEVIDGALVVEGERKFEEEENQRGLYRTERLYGRFYRSIALPENAKTDQARAKFENGVLEVTVPLDERSSNRKQIPVETASQTGAAKKS